MAVHHFGDTYEKKALRIQQTYNPLQNISGKIEKSSKVRQYRKTLMSDIAFFLAPVPKMYFCREAEHLVVPPRDFTNVSSFPKIPSLTSFGNS